MTPAKFKKQIKKGEELFLGALMKGRVRVAKRTQSPLLTCAPNSG